MLKMDLTLDIPCLLLLRIHGTKYSNVLFNVVHICGIVCIDGLVTDTWHGTQGSNAVTIFSFFILLFDGNALDNL
jgi:murein L,D-transpeptidase YafK